MSSGWASASMRCVSTGGCTSRPAARVKDGADRHVIQVLPAVILPVLMLANPARAATCKLQSAQLPVTMNELRPMVHARINGIDAQFIADSGAFFSTLSRASAEQYKLRLGPPPSWFVLSGVGGEARAWLTKARTFTVLNV